MIAKPHYIGGTLGVTSIFAITPLTGMSRQVQAMMLQLSMIAHILESRRLSHTMKCIIELEE
jgi:hypothetical protein